jgi:hypothetical protein
MSTVTTNKAKTTIERMKTDKDERENDKKWDNSRGYRTW